METFSEYLKNIDDAQKRVRLEKILDWIKNSFTNLETRIAWNQPMFTDHGTFIIGFSISKKHLAVAPEQAAISHFSEDILHSGYDHTKELIRIPWDKFVDFSLLERIIAYNISDKADCSTFWRKN